MFKKMVSAALAMAMLLATACSSQPNQESQGEAGSPSGGSGVSAAGELPITSEVVEITCFAPVSQTFTEEACVEIQNWEKETNIRLKVTDRPVADGDSNTAKNLLMASNEYPDIFLLTPTDGFTQSEVMQYGVKDGSFLPLNDYIDQYGYWINDVYEAHPEYKNIMVAPDGNIYGINDARECDHCLAYPKLWMRTDWLEKLDLEMPTTTEELYEVLKAFKEKDPNGNGKMDEIPLTADQDETVDAILINSFLPYFPKVGQWITGTNFCYTDEKNQIHFSGTDDRFREGLRYIAKLYKEGLIDPAAFTQTNVQAKTTVCAEPYSVGAFVAMHTGQVMDNTIAELYSNFHAIEPVKGPDGVQYAAYNPSINGNTKAQAVITDKCENPEAAFRLIDYLMKPEVSFTRERGQEGVDWKYAEKGQKNIYGGELVYEFIEKETGSEAEQTFEDRRFYPGPTNSLVEERAKFIADVDEETRNTNPAYGEARLSAETIPLKPYFYEYILPSSLYMEATDSERFTELSTTINDYMIQSVARFSTGDLDVENESDWETYLSELDRYGLQEFLDLYQKAFDSYNQDVG
ncbi:MAG: extracellular solute-binding protein [Hydrogeniiclostridium sp.]